MKMSDLQWYVLKHVRSSVRKLDSLVYNLKTDYFQLQFFYIIGLALLHHRRQTLNVKLKNTLFFHLINRKDRRGSLEITPTVALKVSYGVFIFWKILIKVSRNLYTETTFDLVYCV